MIEEGSGNWFATEIAKARARGDDAIVAELEARWEVRRNEVRGAAWTPP